MIGAGNETPSTRLFYNRMGNKHAYIQKICTMIGAQCHAAFPALRVHFIIHAPGRLAEQMSLALEETARLPGGASVKKILTKEPMTERSALLGIGVKSGKGLLGLGKKDRCLALININMDDVEDQRDTRHLAYHLAWQAIDLMHYCLDARNKDKFHDGPMIPKRSPANLTITHLKADIFAAAMNTLQGQKNALSDLAHTRAHNSLIPYRLHRVEDYPYVIAAEATQYALSALEKRGLPARQNKVKKACALADEIGDALDDNQLKQWQAFAAPAQNMAWAGHPADEILGAAINTSENPYIRTTGLLVAQFTGITPLSASAMRSRYNSFTGFERNERLHKERMDSIFEAALSKSLQAQNATSLKEAAITQNEKLADGEMLGWCANALQAAEEVFDSSIGHDKHKAENMARRRFHDQKDKTAWVDLNRLGEDIIEQKRAGFAMTLNSLADLCHDNPAYKVIHQSVQHTLADPAYARKLDAANDLAYTPRAPGYDLAPAAPAPRTPAPAPALHGAPTFGGASSQMVRARMLARQKRHAAQQEKNTEE